MNLDINTLFFVTMHVEIMLGLLLFFAWAQSFSKVSLAWWGSAHLVRAGSIMLFGMYGTMPDWLTIDVANAALFGSFSLTWCGARVFDRRSAEPVWCLVGVTIWLLACRLPQFSSWPELRSLVGGGIVTTYIWLSAYEFWRGRDEALVSRWPAIFMLFAHGALFLIRTPLGAALHLATVGADLDMSAWLQLLSLEALLFTISIAFILLAMAKERTEAGHRTASLTDALTGIANRRGFLEQTASSKRWAMDLRPTAVILVDIDRFKQVNDRFGHAIGDRVLQVFADTAQAHIGSTGLVGRWGGDEFAAVLYDVTRNDAMAVAERMRAAFERAAATIGSHRVGGTVSVGMVFSAAGSLDLPVLLVQADQVLYRAKEAGRNRVETAAAVDRAPERAEPAATATPRPAKTAA
jgi:diguanylate cyclase (GGDEF)-like protein